MTTYPLYLNGQFETFGKTLAVINPATAEPFAEVAIAGRARLAAALDDAHAAFLQWRRLTGKARGAYQHAIADRVAWAAAKAWLICSLLRKWIRTAPR